MDGSGWDQDCGCGEWQRGFVHGIDEQLTANTAADVLQLLVAGQLLIKESPGGWVMPSVRRFPHDCLITIQEIERKI